MLIERFRQFAIELRSDELISGKTLQTELFRVHSGVWYDGNDTRINDPRLLEDLTRTQKDKTSWRRAKSSICYYYLEQLEAVIAVEFKSSPKSKARRSLEEPLQKCFLHSEAAFKSTHCNLTGLSNKLAFDERVTLLIKRLRAEATVNPTDVEAASRPGLHLFSFDVDYFKQINDTYGHAYGDILLKTLGRRLQARKPSLIDGLRSNCECEIYRISGDEFCISLYGLISKEETLLVARAIKDLVSEDGMPDDEEWKMLTLASPVGVSLPPLTEREVTLSIGIATINAITKEKEEDRKVVALLCNNADVALYASKYSGRNRAIHFDDILLHHGRVLEQHSDTGIVTINIGKNVGVKAGFEFLVFHPDFTGERPFLYSDGRTQKTIGRYPKMSMARVVAFDVQQDISFCKLADKYHTVKVPTHAPVELIPMGAIAHYIETGSSPLLASSAGQSLSSRGDLENELAKEKDWVGLFVAVFSIRDASSIADDVGVAAINSAVARLYESIESEFGAEFRKAQVAATQIAVIGSQQGKWRRNVLEEKLNRVLDLAQKSSGNFVVFECGIVAPDVTPIGQVAGPAVALATKGGIRCALYLVSNDVLSDDKIRYFSADACHSILYAFRVKGEIRKARAFHQELLDLNVRSALLENQRALIEYGSSDGDIQLAELHAREAVNLEPARSILRINLGLMLVKAGKYLDAYDNFEKVSKDVSQNMKYAYATAAHFAQLQGRVIDEGFVTQLFVESSAALPSKWSAIGKEQFKEIASVHGILL